MEGSYTTAVSCYAAHCDDVTEIAGAHSSITEMGTEECVCRIDYEADVAGQLSVAAVSDSREESYYAAICE